MSGRGNEHQEKSEQRQERTDAREGELSRDVLSDMKATRLAAESSDKGGPPPREVKEDGRVVFTNPDGNITAVKHPDGTQYEYSYDKKGSLTAARIAGKDGDADYWVKGKDGKWQSYDEYYGPNDRRNKPGNLVLNGGNWEVNQDGRLYHSSGQVTQMPERSRK